MTPEERLADLLDQKDAEIEKLEYRISELEEDAELSFEWQKHRMIEENDLPVPRLEIKLSCNDNGFKKRWEYGFVYRHTLDDIIFVPMGVTTLSGGNALGDVKDVHAELPYRDGAHIRYDSAHLNLPAFATVNGKSYPLDPLEKK